MDKEEDIPLTSSSPNDKFLNELTMKLLTNKTSYAKYLHKTDNAKYEEEQQFIQDCNTHHKKIISITDDLCKDLNNEFGTDVKEAFDNYARTIVRYLEVKEKSDEIQKEYDDEESTMFPYSINTMDNYLKKNRK